MGGWIMNKKYIVRLLIEERGILEEVIRENTSSTNLIEGRCRWLELD